MNIRIGPLALLAVFIGCQPARPRTEDEVFNDNFEVLVKQFGSPSAEVPQEVLDKLPARLASLKPGMGPRQVMRTLRLSKPKLTGGHHAPWDYYL